MARVVVENLSKIFRDSTGGEVCAVHDVNLIVEDKEFLVLVGPSGCGKSTTLRLVAGLEEISRGTVAIDGQVINDVPPKDRDIAMVFQNYALYPHMSVFENMAFGLKLRKFPETEIESRVKEASDLLDLMPYLARFPTALSGGQRQRVALGRAIVRKPKVFLFDEPLSNLDTQMRVQMRSELSRLHTRLQATMIYVTHDQVEAMTMGDRIAVMKDGVIQQVATPVHLYHHPANLFVGGFIGSPPMNFFRGTLNSKEGALFFVEQNPRGQTALANWTAHLGEKHVQLATCVGQEVIAGVRPEHISLTSIGAQSNSRHIMIASIERVESIGSETHVYLTTGSHSFVARMTDAAQAMTNQRVSVTLDWDKALFFDPKTQRIIT